MGADNGEMEPARGDARRLFQDAFKELYQPEDVSEEQAGAGGGEEEGEEAGEGDEAEEAEQDKEETRVEVATSVEETMLQAVRDEMTGTIQSLREMEAMLHAKKKEADLADQETDERVRAEGLKLRAQYPIGDGEFTRLLDVEGDKVAEKRLILPSDVMRDELEKIEISQGVLWKHADCLQRARPSEPTYLKPTGSILIRMQARNIRKTLTAERRETLAANVQERERQRVKIKPTMRPEDLKANQDILRRMNKRISFLQNPRYKKADGQGRCPFTVLPNVVTFRSFEIGGVYSIPVKFINTSAVGRRLRVMPSSMPHFTITPITLLRQLNTNTNTQSCEGVVAPGLTAQIEVRFCPTSIRDIDDQLTIHTEEGEFPLVVRARRHLPLLRFAAAAADAAAAGGGTSARGGSEWNGSGLIDCGNTLAGTTINHTLTCRNSGGTADFCLKMAHEIGQGDEENDDMDEEAEGEDAATPLEVGAFSVTPRRFSVKRDEQVTLHTTFRGTEVGPYEEVLYVVSDDGQRWQIDIRALTEAMRVELTHMAEKPCLASSFASHWRTLEEEEALPDADEGGMPASDVLAWRSLPWQLDFPNVRVGAADSHEMTLFNAASLPISLKWTLQSPPEHVAASLISPMTLTLPVSLLSEIQKWQQSPSLPFEILPMKVTLQPGASQTFTFSYAPESDADDRSRPKPDLAVALLQAVGITEESLLTLNDLLHLQKEEGRSVDGGIPLWGTDAQREDDGDGDRALFASSLTLVRLSGSSARPLLTVSPPTIEFFPPVFPFITHTAHVSLCNPSAYPAEAAFKSGAIIPNTAAQRDGKDGKPIVIIPGQATDTHPTPHFFAIISVSPSHLVIPGNATREVCVSVAAYETGVFSGELVADVSDGGQPLTVGVRVEVGGPVVRVKEPSMLNFGIVPARSAHHCAVTLDNPTKLPALARIVPQCQTSPPPLPPLPYTSHAAIVEAFHGGECHAADETDTDIETEAEEEQGYPGVCGVCGCVDRTGRRHKGGGGNERVRVSPSWVIVPPEGEAVVNVTLMTHLIGLYASTVKLDWFGMSDDESDRIVLDVFADVQLQKLTSSPASLSLPVCYLDQPSKPLTFTLTNHSDLPASFQWQCPGINKEGQFDCDDVPTDPSTDGLAVQIVPASGQVRGRESIEVKAVVMGRVVGPMVGGLCRCLVEGLVRPFWMKVSSPCRGLEVHYRIVPLPTFTALLNEIAQQSQARAASQASRVTTKSRRTTAGTRRTPSRTPSPTPPSSRSPSPTSYALSAVSLANEKIGEGGVVGDETAKLVDFGTLDMLPAEGSGEHKKTMVLVFTNRSGIPATLKLNMRTYSAPGGPPPPLGQPATSPVSISPFSTSNAPSAVAPTRTGAPSQRSGGTWRSTVAGRGAPKQATAVKLLSSGHEMFSFSSPEGRRHREHQYAEDERRSALQDGRGFAVRLTPNDALLQPFETLHVVADCFADIPGVLSDDIMVSLVRPSRGAYNDKTEEGWCMPVRSEAIGKPLLFAPQQVGVNLSSLMPSLDCGIVVKQNDVHAPAKKKKAVAASVESDIPELVHDPSAGRSTYTLKVQNASCRPMSVAWQLFDLLSFNDPSLRRSPITLSINTDGETPSLTFEANPPDMEAPPTPLPFSIYPVSQTIMAKATETFYVSFDGTKCAAGSHGVRAIAKTEWAAVKKRRPTTTQQAAIEVVDTEAGGERPNNGVREVRSLPPMQDGNDDSDDERDHHEQMQIDDEEQEHAAQPNNQDQHPDTATSPEPPPSLPLPPPPLLSIDLLASVETPRLVIDKKHDKTTGEPTVKFQISTVDMLMALRRRKRGMSGNEDVTMGAGEVLMSLLEAVKDGERLDGKHPLTTAALVTKREVSLTNPLTCPIHCQLHVEGRFRLEHISIGSVTSSSVKLEDKRTSKPFHLPGHSSVHVTVAFRPAPMHHWHPPTDQSAEVLFNGTLKIHFNPSKAAKQVIDPQTVRLVGVGRRPSVCVLTEDLSKSIPLSNTTVGYRAMGVPPPSDQDKGRYPWGKAGECVVDFGFVHVGGKVEKRRWVELYNANSVPAAWRLFHVARQHKQIISEVTKTLKEREDEGSQDDPSVFVFSLTEGVVIGPTKPHWPLPLGPALPKAQPHPSDSLLLPAHINITFKPVRNVLYKCRYRVFVHGGVSVDFVCRGCGSYDEEDDAYDADDA
ncbi:unnamed protein product [Vitrella brassicaformis CCMP3155]|uniref:Deleted in lung and esophageal cancer protein 1 Ig-like domain-containing protein n=3 Tax=Vitrella brassicaformis TaxID=1169539 RepID=A0A0G4H1W5_VITBC|nr:unnamed protein product [Vitrella brassicaformis CCMP3155]|eukprot:CEM37616.1 unnamed protein product [Vitrella brassicaformis CCMP3155]